MVITDLEAEMDSTSDEVIKRIEQLKKMVNVNVHTLNYKVKSMKKINKKLLKFAENNQSQNEKIMMMLKMSPQSIMEQVSDGHKSFGDLRQLQQQPHKPAIVKNLGATVTR